MTENNTATGPDDDLVPAPIDATEPIQAPVTEVAEPEADVPAEPAAAEPVAAEPAVAEQVTPEPVTPEPVVAEPVVAEPVVAEPVVAEPVVGEPVVVEPVVAEPVVVEPVPATETATPGATTPSTAPTPRPVPRPMPRPMPRAPQAPAPHSPTPDGTTPAVVAAPVAPPLDAAEAAAAAAFGRVDEDGTVHVRETAGERIVGQYPGASAEEALAFYVRRYVDLKAKVVLFEARLGATDMPVKEIDQTLAKLTEETAEPAAVGDLDDLRTRLDAIRVIAVERRAVVEAERAAAKEQAVALRTDIVEQAEKITATDPERIQWRPAGEQLRILLDQWKEAQRSGPRIDRPTEEALWKRFSHARTSFDRERRHFFAELETKNADARATKEALVAEAEALSTSGEFGATAAAYRELMARWKAAGRASRKDDDALWARFRGAQDSFFAARDAATAATDTEFAANLEVKEKLLTQAEKLLPVTDLGAAKTALRDIQERWESAGKVPRGDVQRVEARLRAVETAIRDADQAVWTRGNPETRARAEGAAAQLETAIAGLESDLAAAKAAGNDRKVAEAQTALDARRAWLTQVQRAADDHRA
ncbi:DUF349 domain-containing protein [Pengzhenrongella phosphoraccumulans]|uniref:DUF349 domain-containing protein n=1 Tax=Pengzhenrongella phosphoraccumulans TaxID=3114394 RepID=UPI00388F4745